MARYRLPPLEYPKDPKPPMPLTPLDKGYQLVYPTAMDENDQTCIRELESKQQGEFPSISRFPPMLGQDGACGCLMTTHKDAQAGEIRLETIWQPLWDTQILPPMAARLNFFQNPAGRPTPQTNLFTAGALTWPKRFHLWEVSFHLGRGHLAQFIQGKENLYRDYMISLCENEFVAQVRIGEKIHLQMPFSAMYNPRPLEYRAALCTPLYLPPVQHFMVVIESSTFRDPELQTKIRCVLHGYLHREIP